MTSQLSFPSHHIYQSSFIFLSLILSVFFFFLGLLSSVPIIIIPYQKATLDPFKHPFSKSEKNTHLLYSHRHNQFTVIVCFSVYLRLLSPLDLPCIDDRRRPLSSYIPPATCLHQPGCFFPAYTIYTYIHLIYSLLSVYHTLFFLFFSSFFLSTHPSPFIQIPFCLSISFTSGSSRLQGVRSDGPLSVCCTVKPLGMGFYSS